ncbi:DUF3306 domain-containing protein [Acidovorax sp. Root70]|uniref:DUF3306 domain-containing protein n=1 Tax=Acidovorax sp. Root70 TaxID=1736590 RepID=UPI0006F90CE0|nr:DUF3306 domain-containing protein [Acidovorax sp. Root70]KRB42151.1 hypothetical protein ASD94_00155 [Acidovorax sp. Root70]
MADGFLGRWSRRKQDVLAGKPVQDPPSPAPAPQAATPAPVPAPAAAGAAPPVSAARAPEAPPPPTLADAEALTPASDFKPFVARAVSPEVRNLAMKKLFTDPHFNVMDGLDIYIGDYTQPDPLPAGMLREMASAHALGFFDHEKKADSEVSPDVPVDGATTEAIADTQADTIALAIAQPRDDAEASGAADVAQSGVCNAIPSDPSSELALVTNSAQDAVARPASHTHNDHDAHLRLQPDDAPQRQGVGRGTA